MNELDLIFLNIRYNSENDVYEWLKLRLVLVLGIVVHPFEYSSVLVQLGHEPIPARHSTSFLGKPIMVLPNIFQYGLSLAHKGLLVLESALILRLYQRLQNHY